MDWTDDDDKWLREEQAKRCQECDGKGWVKDFHDGDEWQYTRCGSCGGTGKP